MTVTLKCHLRKVTSNLLQILIYLRFYTCVRGGSDMHKFNIAICDDEEVYREKIKKFVMNYFEEIEMELNIFIFHNVEEFENYDLESIDLLLLDINMPGKSGIELKDEFDIKVIGLSIVFITNHNHLISEAFGTNVIGFVSKSNLSNLDKLIQKSINKKNTRKVIVVNNEYIKTSDIIFIEMKKGINDIVLKDKIVVSLQMMYELEEMLGTDFVRIHRSYIINMNYINIFRSDIELDDGRILPVGRRYKEISKAKYHTFKVG